MPAYFQQYFVTLATCHTFVTFASQPVKFHNKIIASINELVVTISLGKKKAYFIT